MKTLDQYAESIMISLRQVTDESYLSGKEEWIKDKIKDIRSTLAREEFNQNLHVDPQFYSKMDITVECDIKSVDLGKVTIQSTTKLARIELPPLISRIGDPVKYAGDDNVFTPGFNIISLSGFNSSDAALYTSMKPIAVRIGPFLYLKNMPVGMSNATVIVALDDPTDNPNYEDTDVFPVSSPYKLELLVKQDILVGWNIPLDVLHNENDDSIPNSKNTQQNGRSDRR